jgi:hypothetical protein
LAENICLLDGSSPVDVPIVAEGHGLVNFNDLFCRLFHALTKSQGMAALVINPAKAITITELLESTFPAIKSTKNSPTPYVTPVTAAYIFGLVIDSVTALQTESTNQRALRCESMARQELETMTIDAFHTELRLALTSYYEGILKMEGASGVVQKLAYKRPIKRLADAGLDIQGPQPDVNTAAVQAAAGRQRRPPPPSPRRRLLRLHRRPLRLLRPRRRPRRHPPLWTSRARPRLRLPRMKGERGVVNKHDWCA